MHNIILPDTVDNNSLPKIKSVEILRNRQVIIIPSSELDNPVIDDYRSDDFEANISEPPEMYAKTAIDVKGITPDSPILQDIPIEGQHEFDLMDIPIVDDENAPQVPIPVNDEVNVQISIPVNDENVLSTDNMDIPVIDGSILNSEVVGFYCTADDVRAANSILVPDSPVHDDTSSRVLMEISNNQTLETSLYLINFYFCI